MRGRGDKHQSARVHATAPTREAFVAPERDVRSGRSIVGDRSNKHRTSQATATEVPVAAAPRRLPRRIPRWVPATVATAVVAAGIAAIALVAGGGDDNNDETAAANTFPAGAPAAPPDTAGTTTSATTIAATTTAPATTATTTSAQPTTTADATTTTTLPPTTTTTIAPGLDPTRITGYRMTETYTRLVRPPSDQGSDGPNVGDVARSRISCADGTCDLRSVPFKAGQRQIRHSFTDDPGGGGSRCTPWTRAWRLSRDGQGRYRGTYTSDPRHTHLEYDGGECWALAETMQLTLVPIISK